MAINHSTPEQIQARADYLGQFPIKVQREIKEPNASAIWIYLLGMAKDWQPKPADIINSCGLTKAGYKRGMARLAEMGLIEYRKIRGFAGRLLGTTITCNAFPNAASTETPKSRTSVKQGGISFRSNRSSKDQEQQQGASADFVSSENLEFSPPFQNEPGAIPQDRHQHEFNRFKRYNDGKAMTLAKWLNLWQRWVLNYRAPKRKDDGALAKAKRLIGQILNPGYFVTANSFSRSDFCSIELAVAGGHCSATDAAKLDEFFGTDKLTGLIDHGH